MFIAELLSLFAIAGDIKSRKAGASAEERRKLTNETNDDSSSDSVVRCALTFPRRTTFACGKFLTKLSSHSDSGCGAHASRPVCVLVDAIEVSRQKIARIKKKKPKDETMRTRTRCRIWRKVFVCEKQKTPINTKTIK